MTISEAFEVYRTDFIVFKNQSCRTEEAHNYVCRSLTSFLGDIPLADLTFAQVRDWKTDLDKGRTSETVRMYVIRLRVVLKYLRARGYDVLDPESIPVPNRQDKVPSFITCQEISKLLEANNVPRSCQINRTRNKAIISLLFSSGIRVSELCSLDKEDLHENSFTVVGKGGKARLCFFDDRTRQYVDSYLKLRKDGNPALFVSNENKLRITRGNVQFIFRCCARRTGIVCHPHTLRHSFATNLLRNNCNMRYVQELLGHASLQTTQMYTHVINEDLHRVYREHHKI